MGERQVFQPLTREDKITVVLYRIGIVLSTVLMAGLAFLAARGSSGPGALRGDRSLDLLLYGLYASVGMSVFFIHLYVRKFHTFLKYLYLIGIGGLLALLAVGKGSPAVALLDAPARALLLLPLSGCLGFVTAKEAFCFQLVEGYVLALAMPLFLLLAAAGALGSPGLSTGLSLIAALLVLFTLRKVFMPIAFDIGDKSAYH